jgi:hypothetical protein
MQQGIQAAHAIVEVTQKYQGIDEQLNEQVVDWAKSHKTIKMLSGGSGLDFDHNRHIALQLCGKYCIPYSEFNEPDIGDMVTSFCLIVTLDMCEEIENLRLSASSDNPLSPLEFQNLCDAHPLVDFLKQLRPAK